MDFTSQIRIDWGLIDKVSISTALLKSHPAEQWPIFLGQTFMKSNGSLPEPGLTVLVTYATGGLDQFNNNEVIAKGKKCEIL